MNLQNDYKAKAKIESRKGCLHAQTWSFLWICYAELEVLLFFTR